LIVTTATTGADKRTVIRLTIDIRFLRVTAYFHKGDPFLRARAKRDGSQESEVLGALDPAFNDMSAQMSRYRSVDSVVELFALTTGDATRLWAVAWRKSMQLDALFHFIVFFMPKGSAYSTPGECGFLSLKRYLLTAPRSAPFFVSAPINNPLVQTANPVDLAQPEIAPGRPLASEFDHKDPNISGAFVDQLTESGKQAVLALPVPNGTGGAAWGSLLTSDGRLTTYLESLRIALHAFATHWPVSFRSLDVQAALGGFSAGAQPAYLALTRNSARFSGFFWFDVPRTDAAEAAWLKAWLDERAERQVRLIGGDHWERLDVFRAAIARPAQVRLLPPSLSHYTARNSPYAAGLTEPPTCTHWAPLEFAASPKNAPSGSLTASTGVFASPGTAELRYPTTKGDEEGDLVEASVGECAGILAFVWRRMHPGKIDTSTQFQELKTLIEQERSVRRHQWVIGGGLSSVTRGAGFITFFGECIRQWVP